MALEAAFILKTLFNLCLSCMTGQIGAALILFDVNYISMLKSIVKVTETVHLLVSKVFE